MKKLLAFAAAISLCCLAHSQEADGPGSKAEVTIVPRLDLNYNSDGNFHFGQSSIYTLLEGNLSENLSFTLLNNWFDMSLDTPASPYTNLLYSNDNNLFALANISYNIENWTFTLGKDCLTTAGIEYEEWDWNIYSPLATPLWNNLPSYQWGLKAAWNSPDEMHCVSLQATTSPYGERPFASGLYAASLQWLYGDIEDTAFKANVSALEYEKGEYDLLMCLGAKFSLGFAEVEADYHNTYGDYRPFTDYERMWSGHTGALAFKFPFTDSFSFTAKGIYSTTEKEFAGDYALWTAGGILEYSPDFDCGIKPVFHAYGAYNSLDEGFELSAGVRIPLNFVLF